MCAACHSTNLQKNYDLNTDTYHTTYSNINVSCESCHGPGKLHVQYANADYKKGNKVAGHYIDLVKTQSEQLTACAPCHSVRSELNNQPSASKGLLDNYIPQLPATERFYADGQIREEDYIYASFLQNKMMNRGVTCSNCHNSHTGKILYASNQLFLQCHAKTYDAPSHHFHQMNTVEAECKSCHMPGQVYMGNDYRHDHSFRVPRPDLSMQYNIPNACNNCHKDKSYEWSSNAVMNFMAQKENIIFLRI